MRLPYSLCITSCNRHDLLQRTLVSFYSTVDELPLQTYIYEDGPTERPNWLPDEPEIAMQPCCCGQCELEPQPEEWMAYMLWQVYRREEFLGLEARYGKDSRSV